MTASKPSPAARRLASDAVHDRLRGQILSGRLVPGDALPSERALAERHGVNRHAVREALKRLQQAGLVRVSHGGATRVLDWRATGGLELLADLGSLGGASERRELIRSVAEIRASVGADAARLCALRADDGLRGELRALGEAPPEPSYEERLERYERLWELIVEGSRNLAYRLALNSLVGARHGRGVDPGIYAAEVDDARAVAELARAAAGRDPRRAERTARRLLDRTLAAVAGEDA